jgi:hypothetical protein
LVPAVLVERLREGLDDYRRLLMLTRLAREAPGSKDAEALLAEILTPIRLGQFDIRAVEDFARLRQRLDAAITQLR